MLLNKRFIFGVVLFLLHQSLSFAQQSEKLYLKLGFEGSYSQRKDNGNTFSTALSDGKDSVFSEKLSTNGETKECSGKLNLDLLYKINRKNTFSFYFSQFQLKNQNNLFTNQGRVDSIQSNREISAYKAEDYYKIKSSISQFSACYSYNFDKKGRILAIAVDGNFSNSLSEGNNLRIYDNPTQTYRNFNGLDFSTSKENTIALNAFYNIAYDDNCKVLLGVRLNNDWQNKNADYNNYDSLNSIYNIKDNAFSYIYNYRNRGMLFSFDWIHTFNRLVVKADFDWNLRKEAFTYENYYNPDDTSYFVSTFEPSISLNYKNKSGNDFKLDYNLRVTTPSVRDITNHKLYLGDKFMIGNRNLKPSRTHSLIAGWQKSFANSLSLTLNTYYKYSENEIDYATDFTLDDYYGYVISYSMPYNLKTSYKYGIDANASFKVGNLFDANLFANVYRYYYEIDYPKTGLYSKISTSYFLNLKIWRQIFKNIEVYASANYSSPISRLFYEQKENYSIDLGIKTEVFNKKLSLFIDFIDVFNLSKQGYEITNPYFSSFNLNEYKGIYVRFGVNYKFGKI